MFFNESMRDEDLVIKIPQEAVLLQQLLCTFRELSRGSGVALNTFVRVFFSVSDLREILTSSSWNPALLKECVDFFMEVYLSSKNSESSEQREVEAIITEVLVSHLEYYVELTRAIPANRFNQKWKCKAETLNIFEGKNPFGSLRYLVAMNYLYGLEFYILNSLLPCLTSFIAKLPASPSDAHCNLLRKILVRLSALT